MSHRKFEHPRHGSLGFLPRKRAARHRGKGIQSNSSYSFFFFFFIFFFFFFCDLVVVLLSFSSIYLFMLFLFVGQWRLFLRMTQASLAGLLHFWATRLGWLTLSGRSKNPDQVSYFLFFNLSLFCYMIM